MLVVLIVVIGLLILLLASGLYIFFAACGREKRRDWLDRDAVERTSFAKYYSRIVAADRFLKDPRNIFQAEELDKFTQIDKVIDISVDETKLLRRITGRRVCSKCGDSYHVDRLNGATTCARCGGDLITRADDNEETVKSRLQVYRKQTEPLIEYYQSKGKLVTINGDSSIEDAFAEIVNALK